MKEIIQNKVYDSVIDEVKDRMCRLEGEYKMEEIKGQVEDIVEKGEDVVWEWEEEKR